MKPLWLVGPLLFLFILVPLSECLKSPKCRTTEIAYTGGPVDIFMESTTNNDDLCAYAVRYTQIEGHLDCGSNISISITGGAQTCEEGQIGDEREFRCNCRWEKCMDDVIEGLQSEGSSYDTYQERQSQLETIIIAVSSVILVIILIIVGFSIWGCVMCCKKKNRTEEPIVVPVGPPMVPMGPMGPPMSPMYPMGPPPMACQTPMMAAPVAKLPPMAPVAQVDAPPPGTVTYPRFNPGSPPSIAQVEAPPPGTSPDTQFKPKRVPSQENFQRPVPVEQVGSATNKVDLRRKISSKNDIKMGLNSKTPQQGMSNQGPNMDKQIEYEQTEKEWNRSARKCD